MLCIDFWIELFCCCCVNWVRFFDVYLNPNVCRLCCWSLFCFCLHILVNTGSRFLSVHCVLFCLLSLDDDWHISLEDDFCRSFDKGVVGLGSFEVAVDAKEELELGSFVIDGAGFDPFPHDLMYSSTFSFFFLPFCSGVFIVSVDMVVWVDTPWPELMVLG